MRLSDPLRVPLTIITHPANRGRRARALARGLGWQVWQRTVRRPVGVVVPGTRHLIEVHPHATAETPFVYWGLPEWWEMSFAAAWLRPGDVFVDVGAHSGAFTLVATAVPGVRVFAYEPCSATFRRLERNVEANSLSERVVLRRRAVGESHGRVEITTTLDTRNKVVVPQRGRDGAAIVGKHPTEPVEMVTLDAELAAAETVSLVKIDTEGWEAGVVAGAEQILARWRPALLCEDNGMEAAELLETLGYRRFHYDPRLHLVKPGRPSGRVERNSLWLADLTAARSRLGPSAVPPELEVSASRC